MRLLLLGAIAVGISLQLAARAEAAEAAVSVTSPTESVDSAVPSQPTLFVSGGLTADTVARRAQATSPDVRAREQERAAAEAGLNQALAGYLPRLSGVARYTRLSALNLAPLGSLVVAPSLTPGPIPAGTPIDSLAVASLSFPVLRDQWLTQATLQVPLSDYILRIPQTEAAASGNLRAAALAARAARLNVATEARVAYYTWVRALMQSQVAAQAVTQARAHLADVIKGEQAGAASRADVLRVTSQVAAAELLETRARSLATICEEQLHTMMHDAPGTRLQVGENIAPLEEQAPNPAEGERGEGGDLGPGSVANLWQEARDHRLERRALAEAAGALRQQARATRSAALPRLDAVAGLTSANPNPRVFPQQDKFTTTWDAGLQLSWTPTDVFGTRAVVTGTLARAAALEAQQAALDDALRTQVVQAVQMAVEARSAVTTSARGLAAAEESYRVRRLLFQNGRATSVEQTDAETELTRARIEAVNARIDLRTAAVRLRHATGRDVGDLVAN